MSKLKVPLNHAIRLLIAPLVPRKSTFQPLYLWSFIKSLKFYSIFRDDNRDQERIKTLWVPKFHERYIPDITAQADKLHENNQYLKVYELLDRVRLAKDPNILWRIARSLYNLSFHEKANSDIKMTMITEAKIVLQTAFANGGIENAEVHKWMAIILDRHYGLLNLDNRVRYSTLVRYHLERACELNPRDFTSHYILGKWCYQMCQLSWFQRVIAKYFIASEPPKSDYRQAYKYLSRAEELQPRTMLSNLYLLGNTCIQMGQYFKAKYYLNLATSLNAQSENEKCYSVKAQNLMRKLDRYDLARNALFYDPLGFND